MNVTIEKNSSYTHTFSLVDFPTLDSNWKGYFEILNTWPGITMFKKDLVTVLAENKFSLSLTPDEVNAFDVKQYVLVITVYNDVIGHSESSVNYLTIIPTRITGSDLCKITMTLMKIDGTPAGTETKELVQSTTGTKITYGWKGVSVTAKSSVVSKSGVIIIDNETLTTTTNKDGYAEFNVLKGVTVTVSCSVLGTSYTVDTTGIDTIDLSSFIN